MPNKDAVTALALAALDADALRRDLRDVPAATRRVPFSALYAYATNPNYQPPADFLARLTADPAAVADLRCLLETNAIARLPALAAAATEPVSVRQAGTVRLSLTPSRAAPAQVYLLVEQSDPAAPAPGQLFVGDGAMWLRLVLPPFVDGRAQSALEEASAVVTALRDPGSVVILR